MVSTQDEAELILSNKGSLVGFSPLSQNVCLKKPHKIDPPGKESKRKVEAGSASLFAYSVAEFTECDRCDKARLVGLDAWMEHLGQVHTFPSRWPSSKIDDGLMDKGHPYTSVVDSHKKRRAAGVPRPLNSFMIFAQYIRRLTLSSFPDAPNVHISQQVGRLWRNLSNDSREVYAKEARRLQSLHSLEFPDYKYQPRRRLRAAEGDEIDSSSTLFRQAINSQPPSKIPTVVNQYFGRFLHNGSPRGQAQSSPSWEFDSDERHNFANSILDFNVSCSNPNLMALTALQSNNDQRQEIKQHHPEDSSVYPSPFNYSVNTDGAASRLGWIDDRLAEPLGSTSNQMQPSVTGSSILPTEDFFESSEQWYQYHKEESFGEALSLPGIETWTFSGSAI